MGCFGCQNPQYFKVCTIRRVKTKLILPCSSAHARFSLLHYEIDIVSLSLIVTLAL